MPNVLTSIHIEAGDIKKVFKEYPTLNSFGFGVFDSGVISKVEVAKQIVTGQSYIVENLQEVRLVASILLSINKRQSINTKLSSYRLKHWVERLFNGPTSYAGYPVYISNGSFIVAAILMGFNIKREHGSPSAWFNVSSKSIDNVTQNFNQMFFQI